MSNVFKEKTAKILAIEPSGAVRQLLTEVLRSKGFEKVQGVGTFKDAISVIEVEPVHWMIVPVQDEQEDNALLFLALLTQNQNLKGTRLSLFVSEEEQEIVPYAYECGLLSTFSKPCNKQSLSSALDELIAKFEANQWDATRVSVDYLCRILQSSDNYNDQIAFYRNLLDLYPGECEFYAKLVEPLVKIGSHEKAKSALKQATLLGLAPEKSNELIKKHFPNDSSIQDDMKTDSSFNALGISTCLVVEPDSSALGEIEATLKKLGVSTVHSFADGETAWQWVESNNEPHLVIHEWRIPKLTGPYFLQRMRQRYPCIPVIIESSLLTVEDLPLVKEMGVACVVEKPFEQRQFIKAVVQTLQKDRVPNDAEALEIKIRQNLEANKTSEAKKLWEKYRAMGDIPANRKIKIEAEIAFVDKQYDKARDLVVKAITTQTDSVNLLNLLAKCFIKLGDHSAALRCYEKAQAMSPMNVQRLCEIAETNSELGNKDAANAAISAAEKQDGKSESISETKAKVALTSGDAEASKKLMGDLHSLQKVISYMNNKAVSFARTENLEASFDLYKTTLNSIPEDKLDYKATVNYNLALAYARKDLFDDAVKQLDVTLSYGETKVKAKANSLKLKIERAIEKGINLKFQGGNAVLLEAGEEVDANKQLSGQKNAKESQEHEKHENIVSSVAITPGEICCFRLYASTMPHPAKVQQLLGKKVLRYKSREAIERGTTGGVEKMIQNKNSNNSN